MGGSTPVAPVQSNEAQLMMVEQLRQQNEMAAKSASRALSEQQQADDASADQMRELKLREAEAAAQAQEREDRIKKGKKDLLYRNAIGVQDEEDQLGDELLKLGGNY